MFYCKIGSLLAVLDMSDYYGEGKIITRINVPEKFRGKGYGRQLLKQATDWADENGITLWLEINPYGQMTYDELEAWYKRNGFKGHGIYKRRPKSQ